MCRMLLAYYVVRSCSTLPFLVWTFIFFPIVSFLSPFLTFHHRFFSSHGSTIDSFVLHTNYPYFHLSLEWVGFPLIPNTYHYDVRYCSLRGDVTMVCRVVTINYAMHNFVDFGHFLCKTLSTNVRRMCVQLSYVRVYVECAYNSVRSSKSIST
jgi:hypothetical protein